MRSPLDGLTETWTRFDGLYAWCAWPEPGDAGVLVEVGNGCQPYPDLSNQYVLTFISSNCTVEDIVLNAQAANALGVVLVAPPEQATFQVSSVIHCELTLS
jgi:hypothetical protein